MVKVLTFQIIMTRFWYLTYTISSESYILIRVGNQETTISNKVTEIEQIFVLDPVN